MHRVFLLLAEVELNPYLFVIGCLLIFGFFLFRLQRRNSQASTSSPLVRTPRPRSETLRRSETRPAELDRWEVEMHEFVRDFSARLDTKLAALQQLVLMADQRLESLDDRIGKLDRLLERLVPGNGPQDKPFK